MFYEPLAGTCAITVISKLASRSKGVQYLYHLSYCFLLACALDLLFVLDGSSSVDRDFEKMRNFIIDLSSLLNVGPYTHRVGLLEFSGPTRKWPQFPFGFAKTTDDFVDAIKRMPYIQGVTRTGAALKIAKSMLEERRKDVGTIVLVVTDGYSQDDVKAQAEEIRLMGNMLMVTVAIPASYAM